MLIDPQPSTAQHSAAAHHPIRSTAQHSAAAHHPIRSPAQHSAAAHQPIPSPAQHSTAQRRCAPPDDAFDVLEGSHGRQRKTATARQCMKQGCLRQHRAGGMQCMHALRVALSFGGRGRWAVVRVDSPSAQRTIASASKHGKAGRNPPDSTTQHGSKESGRQAPSECVRTRAPTGPQRPLCCAAKLGGHSTLHARSAQSLPVIQTDRWCAEGRGGRA